MCLCPQKRDPQTVLMLGGKKGTHDNGNEELR
jgi:hypothetical protein